MPPEERALIDRYREIERSSSDLLTQIEMLNGGIAAKEDDLLKIQKRLDDADIAAAAEWLAVAAREVDAVVEVLGQAELRRAIAVEEVGKDLGLGTQPSLRSIANAAPQPWADILRDHHKAFLDLASRIETAGSANKDLVRSAQSAALPLLENLEESLSNSTYEARGRRDAPRRRHVLVDGEL
mgnify:CR=1 FL=1